MKPWKLLACASLLLGLTWIVMNPNAVAQDRSKRAKKPVAKKNTKIKAFMRKKLVAADQILEGLTTPDMKLVQKGATSMIHMNKEAMWASFKSPSYAQDSADFVRTAERLIKQSKKEDLEGASHTYAQLTIQCVTCHRRVRNQGVANAENVSQIVVGLVDLQRSCINSRALESVFSHSACRPR